MASYLRADCLEMGSAPDQTLVSSMNALIAWKDLTFKQFNILFT